MGAPAAGNTAVVETVASRQVYASPWMTVREDVVRRSNGDRGVYRVIDSPDIVLVIPRDEDRVHMVEQYRHAVGGRRWEFPSGNIEPGSDADAAAAAARELREETGLAAGSLVPLGVLEMAPGMLSHRCRVFLATNLTQGPPQRDPEERDVGASSFSRYDLEQMMWDGRLTDAKTAAAYAFLLMHERREVQRPDA
jgi:8-oxo-dGTP pyrophosphatase MutT (NUDIX family)